MIQADLCDVSRGTLVTVWSMPLIFEGVDPTRKKYMFRYPFSFQFVDECEETIKAAVEIVTKFDTVKDSYLRMLSEEIFQKVFIDQKKTTMDTVQGFLCAFIPDLSMLTQDEIQNAVNDAQDRLESSYLLEAI